MRRASSWLAAFSSSILSSLGSSKLGVLVKKIIEYLATRPSLFLYFVFILACLLRLVVWLQARAIFWDEANLIRNFIEKPYAALWANLDYEQYAPPIYACLSKLSLSLFGVSELSARLIPFLASIGFLYFFYKISTRLLSPWLSMVALAFVGFGRLFVWYGTECKQYSSDAFIAVFLLYLAINHQGKTFSWQKSVPWTIVGSISIWASMPSVFVLAGVASFFFLENKRNKKAMLWLSLPLLFWIANFSIYFFTQLQANAAHGNLQHFHSDFFYTFPPTNLLEWKRFWQQTDGLFTHCLDLTVVGSFLGILGTCVGIYQLWKSDKSLLLLLSVPLISTLVASAMHYYSLIPRMLLFFVPILSLLLFIGLDRVFSLKNKLFSLVLSLLLLISFANRQQLYAFYSPLKTDYPATKTGLDYVRSNQKEGDVLFAPVSLAASVRYYTKEASEPYVFDSVFFQPYRCCDDDLIQQDLQALQAGGAKRIWVLYNAGDPQVLKDFVRQSGGQVEMEKTYYRGFVFLTTFTANTSSK